VTGGTIRRFAAAALAWAGAVAALPAQAESCVRAARPIPAGTVPAGDALRPQSCPEKPLMPAFRYDPNEGVVRVVRTLAEGEIAPAPPPFAVARVEPGRKLRLEAKVGAVVVEREVEAVQAGAAGESLFVRTADGAVFAVPAPEAER